MNKLFKLAGVSVAALSAALYASSVTESLAADITKSSDLQDFTKVQLNTSSDINITVGSGFSIEMVGDEERIGLPHMLLRILHVPDIDLADGTEGPLAGNIHAEAALDGLAHLSLHRGPGCMGVLQHIGHARAGEGF